MAAAPGKTPKKERVKAQTPEERQAALRYNRMMYGPKSGESRLVIKKIDFGAAYITHPKFQNLMTAFKSGSEYQFSVTDKDKSYTISTKESQILFDNKVIYYSRDLNRFERNLLIDKIVMIQFQAIEAFAHLAFAVIRSLPELGAPKLSYKNNEFLYDTEGLAVGIAEQGPNLLVGPYKINTAKTK